MKDIRAKESGEIESEWNTHMIILRNLLFGISIFVCEFHLAVVSRGSEKGAKFWTMEGYIICNIKEVFIP